MFQLIPAGRSWWGEPLALLEGKCLPAELVVLKQQIKAGEAGAWLNSRGTKTAVIDLVEDDQGRFHTARIDLPSHVQECLESFYAHPEVVRGVYDFVIWGDSQQTVRFVEVKCPHWDRVTREQQRFRLLAEERDIEAEIVEWEFAL